MTKRRVVITGLGLLTSLGHTHQQTWQNLVAARSGVRRIEHFDASQLSCQISSSVQDFDASSYVDRKEQRKMDLFIQYAIAAAVEAITDADLANSQINPERVGTAIGSGIGGLAMITQNHSNLLKGGPRKVSPFMIPGSIVNMPAGYVSMRYGYKGPNIAISTACTTGLHNIGHAARMISYGDSEVMIAGGSEMATSELGMAGFASARALSTRNDDPETASRPWDKDRDGFVLGDGAGILVLEEYQHAKQRGARMYAEVTGFGMSGDAHHITSPPEDGQGASQAMRAALADAQITPDQVGYINAHGTSTPVGDVVETRAIKRCFGDASAQLAVGSSKSMLGHLLGAAGSVETIITALSLYHQVLTPTINLHNPEDECDLDYVPHTARDAKLQHALCNAFGFGGTNGCIALSRI